MKNKEMEFIDAIKNDFQFRLSIEGKIINCLWNRAMRILMPLSLTVLRKFKYLFGSEI